VPSHSVSALTKVRTFEDLGVEGTIILTWMLIKRWGGGVEWINLDEDVDRAVNRELLH